MVQKSLPDSIAKLYEQYILETKIRRHQIPKSVQNIASPQMIIFALIILKFI